MIQLTRNYWHNFKQDGLLFEELVGDLLRLEYPNLTFVRTKTTYDGSRDWETKIPVLGSLNAEIWFECKYYRENLPVQAVAMTLVMAYAENAEQIVFFSYSRVNREFPKKVMRFSERSGIPIKIYDDTALEKLILQHWSDLDVQKYFPDAVLTNRERVSYGLSGDCEVDKGGIRLPVRDRKSLPVVRFNDTLTLRYTLFNHDNDRDYNVKIWLNERAEEFFYICSKEPPLRDSPRTLVVGHNGIAGITLLVKLKKFGDRIPLPTLHYEWDGKSGYIRVGYVEGQWLAETELIGQTFYDILSAQNKMMRRASFAVSQIVGRSGVGKSRLMQEIALQGQVEEKQVLRLDFDFDPADYRSFVRRIVSELEQMPELPPNSTVQIPDTNDQSRDLALRILYDDKYFDALASWDVVRYLLARMGRVCMWLVLDNVQWLDERALGLLSELFAHAGEPSSAGVVITFNQDYLYPGTAPFLLSKETLARSAQKPEAFFATELEGFAFRDAVSYLRACLSYGDARLSGQEDFRETLERIVNHCGTQPFFLQNMLIYLFQCRVLERTDWACFYITDISAFWTHIQKLPKTVEALLERRIAAAFAFFEANGEGESFADLCRILAFAGSIPLAVYRDLFPDTSIRRSMIALGILAENGEDNLTFYHQYFEKYFQKRDTPEELPQDLLERFCASVEARGLIKPMLEPYFLANYTLHSCKHELAEAMLRHIAEWRLSPRFNRRVGRTMLSMLRSDADDYPSLLVARCYPALCFQTSSREGLNNTQVYFEQCYEDLIDGQKKYTEHRGEIFPLIREYLLSLGNTNQNRRAILQAERFLPRCQTSEERGAIHEILCISNYTIGNTENAQAAIDAALQCVRPDSLNYIRYIREAGRIYYYHENAYRYKGRICREWERAFSLFCETWHKKLDLRDTGYLQKEIAAYLDAGIADLIGERLAEARKKVDYLAGYLDRTKMPYYEIKIRMFKALSLLMEDMADGAPGRSYAEIRRLSAQAADHCVAYFDMQDYPTCVYLQASAQLYAGQYEEAIDSYQRTCVIIQKCVDSVEEEYFWRYFYEDMALRFAQLGKEFPSELLERVQSGTLHERIRRLCRSRDPEADILQCCRSPIPSMRGPWGLPKI